MKTISPKREGGGKGGGAMLSSYELPTRVSKCSGNESASLELRWRERYMQGV